VARQPLLRALLLLLRLLRPLPRPLPRATTLPRLLPPRLVPAPPHRMPLHPMREPPLLMLPAESFTSVEHGGIVVAGEAVLIFSSRSNHLIVTTTVNSLWAAGAADSGGVGEAALVISNPTKTAMAIVIAGSAADGRAEACR
jgi:hypothetical protein